MGLQQFEERLERLVEGTLAKPFRSNLQPVEIGRRLTREMDLHRRVQAEYATTVASDGLAGLIKPYSRHQDATWLPPVSVDPADGEHCDPEANRSKPWGDHRGLRPVPRR